MRIKLHPDYAAGLLAADETDNILPDRLSGPREPDIAAITMAGAFWDEGAPDPADPGVFLVTRLKGADEEYLRAARLAAAESGVRFAPRVDVVVQNIADDEEGGNFLKNPAACDMLLVCFIWRADPAQTKTKYARDFTAHWRSDESVNTDRFDALRQSWVTVAPEQRERDAWPNAAARAGAKIVASFGGYNEIGARDFHHTAGYTAVSKMVGRNRAALALRDDCLADLQARIAAANKSFLPAPAMDIMKARAYAGGSISCEYL